jgi:hypothetical protein
MDRIRGLLPDSIQLISFGKDEYRLSRIATSGSNYIINSLRELDLHGKLSFEKRIPDLYKYNSPEVRLEILRGLLDTDAYISSGRNGKGGCQLIHTTTSLQLANDILFIVQSLGGTCATHEKLPTFTYKGEHKTGRLAYNITIRMPYNIIPVSSSKQLSRYIPKTKYQPVRFIESIEDIGIKDSQCIKVDATDQLYVCSDFIVTHNTLSSLMAVSNSFDTNRANKALFIVPTTVYEKWMNECRNHTEKIIDPDTGEEKEIMFYGALPHINVVGLSNLSNKVLLELKEYTKEEKKRISEAKSGYINFLDKIKKALKGMDFDTSEESTDDSEIQDGSEDKVEVKKAKSIPVLLPKNYSTPLVFVNQVLEIVNIEVLSGFGISNTENKTYSAIYSIIANQFTNNTMSSTLKSLYVDAGVRLDKIKYFDEIIDSIHASVILSYVYNSYSKLESNLIATLGNFREFPNKTIFFTTYSGLARLGFKDDTINVMANRLLEILKGADLEKGDSAKIQQNIESLLLKSELEAKVYFEDLGFDYIVIDEAHRLKNLITTITTKENDDRELYPGNKSQIRTIKGGSQSKAALIGFMATMYVQMKNGGRNTLLLTATPFTNSPLEIYSMLTLTNYDYLNKLGYDDVLKFAQDFIKIKSQLSISVEGTVKTKIEPVGYTNLQLLRRIIYTIVDFRSADESNIVRPCKIVLPIREKSTLCDSRKSHGFSIIKPVSTIVIPTRQQQFIFDALQQYLSDQLQNRTVDQVFMNFIIKNGEEYYKKVSFSETGLDYSDYMQSVSALAEVIKQHFNLNKEGMLIDKLFPSVAILKTLMAMRHVSISPYMFRPYVNSYLGIEDKDIDTDQVITQSSKLLYVLSCIKKANNIQRELGKPLKGIVLYSNLGTKPGKNSPVSLLKIIKQYLLDEKNEFGYETGKHEYEDFRKKFDDVEILDGESAANPKKKNALMNLFNRGQIKVMITTIREGVDLNGDTSTLFNLSADWNPADAKQIEGRVWRQGNKNAYCIIVYPLTANGSDMAIYQKLQDKTYRLKALWDKSSNLKSAFDLDEFNPEELKMQMISRVEKLAPFKFNEETTAKRYEYDMLKSKKEEDEKVISNYRTFISKELQLRHAMIMFTRVPKFIERENKKTELNKKINQSEGAIKNLKQNIEEEKYNIPEYSQLNVLSSEITTKNVSLKSKAGDYGMFLAEDKTTEAAGVKKEIDQIKLDIKVLEKKKEEISLSIEKLLGENIKDIEKDIRKEEKELEKLKKSLEVINEEIIPIYEIDKKVEFTISEQNKGNYFVKSETGGIVYKEKGISLDKIDWVNKATIFDLFEGLTRIVETYTNHNSIYSTAFADYSESTINLSSFNDTYKFIPIEYLTDFVDYAGSYDSNIYIGKFLGMVKDFQSTYNKQYWNIFYVTQMKASILRSLKDFNQITDGKDPDEYMQEMDEKINKLYQEIGATENMLEIPDEVIEKYIEKAYQEISHRRQEYSSYINLVDGYAGFADLFNIELESVFIDPNAQKELVEKATIKYAEEVVDKNEALNMIQVFNDKIDVYKEMIHEASEDEKEKYNDKIEVYKEMIQELNN